MCSSDLPARRAACCFPLGGLSAVPPAAAGWRSAPVDFPPVASAARRACGYTLIELVTVIVIMGIIAGVAIPKVVGSLYSGKQRSEAFQLLTAIRYAQGMAALQRAPYRLHFDFDTQSYYLTRDESRSDEFELSADTLGKLGGIESLGMPAAPPPDEFAEEGGGSSNAGYTAAGRVELFDRDSHQLPTGVSIERIIDDWDEEYTDGSFELLLNPKGTSSGARIYLVAARKNSPRYVIQVGANGLCRLYRDNERRRE